MWGCVLPSSFPISSRVGMLYLARSLRRYLLVSNYVLAIGALNWGLWLDWLNKLDWLTWLKRSDLEAVEKEGSATEKKEMLASSRSWTSLSVVVFP